MLEEKGIDENEVEFKTEKRERRSEERNMKGIEKEKSREVFNWDSLFSFVVLIVTSCLAYITGGRQSALC